MSKEVDSCMRKALIALAVLCSLMMSLDSVNASSYPLALWNVVPAGGGSYLYFDHCFTSVFFANYTLAPNYDSGGAIMGGACRTAFNGHAYGGILAPGNYRVYITCENQSASEHFGSYTSTFTMPEGNDTIVNVANITLPKLTDWSATLGIPNPNMPQNSTNNVLIWNRIGDTNPAVGNGGDYVQESTSAPGETYGESTDQWSPYDSAFIACNPIILTNFNPNKNIGGNSNWCGGQSIYGTLYNQFMEARTAPTLTFTITNCTFIPPTTTLPGGGLVPVTPIYPINATEWTAAGYGWILPFFSAFFLSTLFIVGVSAGAGMVGGPWAGVATGVIMILALSVMGIYPQWVAIIIVLFAVASAAMMFSKIGH
jgi:hypothetical protein